MLAAYSANRQTSQRIRMTSSSPVQNGDASGYSVCARPRFAPCVLQRHEPVLVQTFLSQPAVERLHGGIVRRCSRSREIDTDPSFIHPYFPGKFRAVSGSVRRGFELDDPGGEIEHDGTGKAVAERIRADLPPVLNTTLS